MKNELTELAQQMDTARPHQADDALPVDILPDPNHNLSQIVSHVESTLNDIFTSIGQSAHFALKCVESTHAMLQTADLMSGALSKARCTTMDGNAALAELEARASGIGILAGRIDAIAKQTQLFAANAAGMATRANMEWHGLATIADEMYKLASQSKQIVREMIGAVTAMSAAMRNMSRQLDTLGNSISESRAAADDFRHQLANSTSAGMAASQLNADINQGRVRAHQALADLHARLFAHMEESSRIRR